MQRIIVLLVALPLMFILLSGGPCACWAEEIEAVTKPSADIELSFVKAGAVAEVLVNEGDAVTVGQLLARQDDRAEQIQLLQLQAKASNKSRVEAAAAE